ncbi:hypothetical protein FZ103_24260 [Streptomonospora sp. PA3]|uniref:hypothetical protein n=1 Tax=Streptomonospora sp. PA3 TaxID=2607326 RepID=UPI0012DF9B0E|nr:hypothetical protein [Streptomonospora sp. PA3]MUL44236.1 hypothetical protein [Streptomonospora sp. PA3]
MDATGMLQSAESLPDHGQGRLGKIAHGALADAVTPGAAAEHPRLYVGYNTLPDPPFPMAGFLGNDAMRGAWRACGGELWTFLAEGARSLRESPVPQPGSVDERSRSLQRMMRVDAMVLVWSAHLITPEECEGGRALAANIAEGYLRPGDLDASPAARPCVAAWAVDRAGTGLILWREDPAADGGAAPDCTPTSTRDPVVAGIAELLDAQYTWTATAFGY